MARAVRVAIVLLALLVCRSVARAQAPAMEADVPVATSSQGVHGGGHAVAAGVPGPAGSSEDVQIAQTASAR